MDSARLAAPQVDRLVLSVNALVGEGDPALAASAGLNGPGLAKHFADWMLSIGVPREIAVARLPYLAAGAVDAWLDAALEAGAIREQDGRLFANAGFEPLARSIGAARAAAGRGFWAGHEDTVGAITEQAGEVVAAAPPEFAVAVSHGQVPLPSDPFQALHQRLTTLRYVRAYAHVQAWTDAGLTRQEIVAMTSMWNRETAVGIPGSLVQQGYVDGTELTEVGELVRGEIEYETNQRVQPVFDALSDPEAFVERLRSLPTDPDDGLD